MIAILFVLWSIILGTTAFGTGFFSATRFYAKKLRGRDFWVGFFATCSAVDARAMVNHIANEAIRRGIVSGDERVEIEE